MFEIPTICVYMKRHDVYIYIDSNLADIIVDSRDHDYLWLIVSP